MEKTVQYFFDIIDIMADIFVLNTFPRPNTGPGRVDPGRLDPRPS